MAEMNPIQESIHLVHMSRQPDGQTYPDYFLRLTFEFVEDEGQWCGHCVELGTATFAETQQQTRYELLEATKIQLAGVESLDELEEYLESNEVTVYAIPRALHAEEMLQQDFMFSEAIPAQS